MKKVVVMLSIVMLVCVWSTSSSAFPAQTLSFGYPENVKYWDGWQSSNSDTTDPLYNDDNYDTIGIPDVLGGKVTLDDQGYLESVSFEFDAWGGPPYSHLYPLLQPGDLFLDLAGDQNWDYVVDTDQQLAYSVNIALGDSSYLLSDAVWAADNPGNTSNIRNDHPVEVDPNALPANDEGTVSFSGWGTTVIEYDFTGLTNGIYIGYEEFIIGWTLNCANDVVYEKVDPVPEPGTLLLLGAGLIGVLAVGRKHFTK